VPSLQVRVRQNYDVHRNCLQMQCWRQAWARGLSPQMDCLTPTVKHTGQESRGKVCEVSKFGSFLQSKSVNNVCKLLQLLQDFLPQTPYQGFAPGDPGLYPQMKIPGAVTLQAKKFYPSLKVIHLTSSVKFSSTLLTSVTRVIRPTCRVVSLDRHTWGHIIVTLV